MTPDANVQGGVTPQQQTSPPDLPHALPRSAAPPAADDSSPGYIGRIPVRNLWLLVLYASDEYRSQRMGPGTWDRDDAELPDLLGRMLTQAVEERLRRPLTRGYTRTTGPVRKVRGRIDAWQTERGAYWPRGQVVCTWHEHSLDTPRHRLVLAALLAMARVVRDPKVRARCREQATALQQLGVQWVQVDARSADLEVFGRHDAHDRSMVQLARLALELILPSDERGPTPLPDPGREERWVRKLFEKAVLGFYRAHLCSGGWTVSGSQPLQWPVDDASAGARDWLPGMRLDISLRSPEGQRMVIDTKFTTLLQSGHHSKERFSSGHLYQLYAYLRTQAGTGDPMHDHAHGVLLYPSIGVDHLEWVTLQGHRMTLATVDLASTPAKMRSDLMRLVGREAE